MRAPAVVMAMLAATLCAGAGPGTFRAGTSLVLVDVSVLDSKDRPVATLAQDQFRILDDGRERLRGDSRDGCGYGAGHLSVGRMAWRGRPREQCVAGPAR